jgi:hypothetical protein
MPNVRSYYAITIPCSLSIMFDEASDIQMNGKLNVFVNVCLYTGEVRTLTLALQGLIFMQRTCKIISYMNCISLSLWFLFVSMTDQYHNYVC